MIQEAYVSFETAKLLKEKGFKEECYTFYEYNSKGFYREERVSWNTSYSKDCAAPTHQMAMEWLRDVYNIFILVGWNPIYKEYFTRIIDMTNGYPKRNIHEHTDYNEAVEAAIKYSLENLI